MSAPAVPWTDAEVEALRAMIDQMNDVAASLGTKLATPPKPKD